MRRWGVVVLLAAVQVLVVAVGAMALMALPARYRDRPSADARGLFPETFTPPFESGAHYSMLRAAANERADREFVLRLRPSLRARLIVISCAVGDYRLEIGSGVIEGPCEGLKAITVGYGGDRETWRVAVSGPQPIAGASPRTSPQRVRPSCSAGRARC